MDSLAPLPQAIHIAKRARAIAQSVWIGLGLSLAGMVAAALGHLSPLQGALLQEAIDVAVILNAMRVLGGPRDGREPTAEAVGHPDARRQPAGLALDQGGPSRLQRGSPRRHRRGRS